MRKLLLSAVLSALLPAAAFAGEIVTSEINPFMGVCNDNDLARTGLITYQIKDSPYLRIENLLDGDKISPGTDTWVVTSGYAGMAKHDFVGANFSKAKDIQKFNVTVRSFGDGGWWTNDPAIKIQIVTQDKLNELGLTLDNSSFTLGTQDTTNDIWEDADFTLGEYGTFGSEYGALPNTETRDLEFTLDAKNVVAIRAIGDTGGTTAGFNYPAYPYYDGIGFLAVTEISFEGSDAVPEPATLTLLALGGIAALRKRKSKKA